MPIESKDKPQTNSSAAPATVLPQLEESIKAIERYAFIRADAPFVSQTPVVGPLIAFAKNLLRRVLRWGLPFAIGSQDEFNAAVAEILVEFTHRAALAPGEPPGDVKLDGLLKQLDASNPRDRALITAFAMLTREISLLREGVRAANLSAAEMESTIAELQRELEKLKRSNVQTLQR